jgi:hypothetical protein
MVTYLDVFPSILARSVGNWTGFGEMPSLNSISPAAEDGIMPKPVQFPTERARIDAKTSWYIFWHYNNIIQGFTRLSIPKKNID